MAEYRTTSKQNDLEKKCMYCGVPNGQYEVYYVRKAIKPKRTPRRWTYIGYCCEDCKKKGNQIEIEFGKD